MLQYDNKSVDAGIQQSIYVCSLTVIWLFANVVGKHE